MFKKRGDLIYDDYGNYYYIIEQQGNHLTLVNAFMDLSFRRKLDNLYIEEHIGEYIGEHAMNLLKGNINMIDEGRSRLRKIALSDLKDDYNINVISLYER